MSEKNDYQILRKNMPKRMDRLERIENVAGTGTPDVNFCSEGVECWIEMKSSIEPRRNKSLLFASNHKLSQVQKNWFLQQRNAGGRCYILIATDKRWMLIDGKYADGINKMTVTQLWENSLWRTPRPANAADWKLLRDVLKA